MSTFVESEDGRLLSFEEYLMSESFRPVEIQHGTNKDANNLEFGVQGESIYTLFKLNGVYYCVQYRVSDGRIGFGGSDQYSTQLKDYPDSPIRTKNAFKVFNHVFYIVSLMIKSYNLSKFIFTGARDGLIVVYSKMPHNKSFTGELNKLGFEYKGNDNGTFIYGKISQ
jgi:hypothetical protein